MVGAPMLLRTIVNCGYPIWGRRLTCLSRPGMFSLAEVNMNFRHLSGLPNSTFFRMPEEDNNMIAMLRKRPGYDATFFIPENLEEAVERKSTVLHPSVQKFWDESLSPSAEKTLGDQVYEGVISSVLENLPALSYSDLLALLLAIKKFPYVPARTPGFEKLWKGLDEDCFRRLREGGWSLDECFVLNDAWIQTGLHRFSDFHWYMIKRNFRKCDKLSPVQYVRFMLCLNKTRSIPEAISTYELEHCLKQLIHELSIEEIIPVALAFFKTSTPIRDDELLFQLMDKVTANVGVLDSYSVTAACKIVRLSAKFNSEERILKLMRALVPYVDRLAPVAALHAILMGTNQTTVLEPALMEAALVNLEKNVKSLRLKELERTALVLAMFNLSRDSLAKKIVEELYRPEREKELEAHGRCLPSILHYLSFKEIFPEDLISRALAPEYLKKHFGNCSNRVKRDLLVLDITTQIECPNYQGPHLAPTERKYLLNTSTYWLPWEGQTKTSVYQKNVISISDLLADMYSKKPLVTSILPHFHVIVTVFCTDKNGKPVEVPPYLREPKQSELKILPKAALVTPIVFHVFLITSRTSVIHGTHEPVGNVHLHARQLRKLGYTVHTIHTGTWIPLSLDERKNILQHFIAKGCKESRWADEENVRADR